MQAFKPQLLILKASSVFLTIIIISIILTHSKTGFITRTYGDKIPRWDDTRELLNWEQIANILMKMLKQKELDSLATLNWYDSGQLSSAFHYKYLVGVIGPNSNHFKYINLNEKNFSTLVDIQLIHKNEHVNSQKKIFDSDYIINSRVELPLFRGNQKYGIITVFSVRKIN